jgi:hypothetical protein
MNAVERDQLELQRHLELCAGPLPPTPAFITLPTSSEAAMPSTSDSEALSHSDTNADELADSLQQQALLCNAASSNLCLISGRATNDATLSKPTEEPNLNRAVGDKCRLLNLPNEILSKILKPLLVSNYSIANPTFGYDALPQFKPRLESQILRVCRQLYHEGRDLLYRQNMFNTTAHKFGSGSGSRGFTPVSRANMDMIAQLHIQVEELHVHHLPPMPWQECVELGLAMSDFPEKRHRNVNSVLCTLATEDESRDSVLQYLGVAGEFEDVLGQYQNNPVTGTRPHRRYLQLSKAADELLVKWNAILLASSVRQACPHFTRMFYAWRLSEEGGEKKRELSIILCGGSKDMVRSVRAFNKTYGIRIVSNNSSSVSARANNIQQCELSVDLERGEVKEISGRRAGRYL